eukprot:TRINITY_DN4083_c0_g1_i2.p1 TRINITY_DN4083_c0_g1~~TRINITY_DN4083_c0_g1_i2.p1  ORF type:complete len:694 (+),score=114.49 TRINITY_DN4083_c0_g1_i2:548-2629(+)
MSWSEVESVGPINFRPSMVSVGSRLYFYGGRCERSSASEVDTLVVFDIETQKFLQIPYAPKDKEVHSSTEVLKHPPGKLSGHMMVAVGKTIYLLGGYNSTTTVASCFAYNVAENSWKRIKDMPKPRAWGTVCHIDGSLWVFGGKKSERARDSLYRYDIEADTWWEIKQKGITPRFAHSMVAYDTKLYVFGGRSTAQPPESSLRSKRIYVLDTIIDGKESDINEAKVLKWRVLDCPNGPSSRSNHSACIIGHHMIVYGGDTHRHQNNEWSPCANETFEFDLKTETWYDLTKSGSYPISPRDGMSIPRDGFPAMAVVSKNLFVFRACKVYSFFTDLGIQNQISVQLQVAFQLFEAANKKLMTDTLLFVGAGATLHAHKLILKLRCEALLSNPNALGTTNIETATLILKYIYTGTLDHTLDWQRIAPLCPWAKVLHLPGLLALCENSLSRKIAHYNVIPIYQMAASNDLSSVVYNCEEYLETNRKDLEKYPQYSSFFAANPDVGGSRHKHKHPSRHVYVDQREDETSSLHFMFKMLLQEGVSSDFMFRCLKHELREPYEINAHKLILGVISPYLWNLVNSPAQTKKGDQFVMDTDFTPSQIRSFLKYAYLGDIEVPAEEEDVMMNLARTFQVESFAAEIKWRLLYSDKQDNPLKSSSSLEDLSSTSFKFNTLKIPSSSQQIIRTTSEPVSSLSPRN